MEGKKFAIVLQIINLLGFIFVFDPSLIAADEEQNGMQTYIVWVEKPPVSLEPSALSHEDLERWYRSFLPENMIESSKQTRIVHAYHNVATGFAAKLTPEEVKAMEKKQGFVSAHLEAILPLHTTHSLNFLGLQHGSGFWKGANYGKGVIIGVLDTGISPDHPSFSDKGVPSPPAKWKGKCEFDGAICNNKLIGARSFVDGQPAGGPPFDREGHGTHTASTAGGNFVKHAAVFEMAKGTAVGMAPYAHLAIYKVCSILGCFEGDILAAFDAAVDDGVDVISLSVGGPSGPFYTDGIAIGAFGAMQKGIFVSCSAGNSGPSYSSLSNVAPWILTVGASTIDRSIRVTTRLGNKKAYNGESLFQPKNFSSNSKLMLPLVYASTIGNTSSPSCEQGTLENVRGKIVLCERGGMSGRVDKGAEVKRAGGAAMILMNQEIDGYSTSADPHVLPATHVSYAAGLKIKSYIKSSSKPTATILLKGTVIGDSQAPSVASFSSRGPSIPSPGILKPDIIGPGVSILAAWPVPVDKAIKSKATFNIISGTSMSCPHLSGIAALLKSFHPDWSPAAIKSAIMTTADVHNLGGKSIVDQTLRPADIFAIGAGHVNPTKANDPGLIYDTQPNDYIRYLCGLKYTEKQIQIITQQKVKCSEVGSISETQLNYPTFSLIVGSNNKTWSQLYTRTVKNVGPANSTYKLEILAPQKMNVDVSPPELRFLKAKQIITYRVKFTAQKGAGKEGVSFGQGYLRWVSDKYKVTSPIAVLF